MAHFFSHRLPEGILFPGSILFLVLFSGAAQAQTDYLAEMGYDRLSGELGFGLPDGTGIQVAQVEASISTSQLQYAPQGGSGTFAGGGNYSGKFFTAESGASPNASSHAAAIADHFYGNRTDPGQGRASMAPGVSVVSCFEANDYLVGTGVFPTPGYLSATGKKVHSHAWIGSADDADDLLKDFDASIDSSGYLPVVGLNNGSGHPVPELLASAYNVLSTGRSDGQHGAGVTPGSVAGAGRMKPELVAPYPTTSESTGGVSSLATVLYEVADTTPGLGNAFDQSEVMKAIILAGATKDEFPQWSRSATAPLDATFGAGEANVYESYRILTAGEQAPGGGAVGLEGWDFERVLPSGADREYPISVSSGFYADELSVVLNWNRRGVSGIVHDLNLELRDSAGTTVWDASRSAVDNVEHIHYRNLPAGDYVLRVSRNTGSGSSYYGIAWRAAQGLGPVVAVDLSSGTVLHLSQLDLRVSYTIQRSTDFGSWTDVHTFTPTTPTHQWPDLGASGERVYYRLKWEPFVL